MHQRLRNLYSYILDPNFNTYNLNEYSEKAQRFLTSPIFHPAMSSIQILRNDHQNRTPLKGFELEKLQNGLQPDLINNLKQEQVGQLDKFLTSIGF